jgi:hypothetical protein
VSNTTDAQSGKATTLPDKGKFNREVCEFDFARVRTVGDGFMEAHQKPGVISQAPTRPSSQTWRLSVPIVARRRFSATTRIGAEAVMKFGYRHEAL